MKYWGKNDWENCLLIIQINGFTENIYLQK